MTGPLGIWLHRLIAALLFHKHRLSVRRFFSLLGAYTKVLHAQPVVNRAAPSGCMIHWQRYPPHPRWPSVAKVGCPSDGPCCSQRFACTVCDAILPESAVLWPWYVAANQSGL